MVDDAGVGKRIGQKVPLHNDEAKLRKLYGRMKAHGPGLRVVDQPATIGALAVAVALAESVTVAYLPGPAIRRIAKSSRRAASFLVRKITGGRSGSAFGSVSVRILPGAQYTPVRERPDLQGEAPVSRWGLALVAGVWTPR